MQNVHGSERTILFASDLANTMCLWLRRNDQLAWFGELTWALNSTGAGVLFCAAGNDSSVGPWQAYAALDNVTYGGGCLGASLITSNATKAGGYEYSG